MRRLSLNARQAQDAQGSGQIHVALFEISHPSLDAPIRLSTDNTERLSDEPRMYGTRSSWRGANPLTEPYHWVVASALLPSDLEDAPSSAAIVLEDLDGEMARLMRSFGDMAFVRMADVLASSPNEIEAEWSDMTIQSSSMSSGEVTLALGREEIEQELFPSPRMSRTRFPGLHL
ncbi:hypothetical protein [Puniceibacterium sp. IMCC21224]|uniref:hypothetical protein n=1 Tax=Puniceibacterium sp. IMCC21224 TaxID=1618204 RepID=UPI00064DA2E6|nr:hypothetical protein [Puniceibacterium sp. IMCC21224]KMK68587.1 hypothetical protein IMCC21224_113470 [Puniceibacterium sp. IMCC21224]